MAREAVCPQCRTAGCARDRRRLGEGILAAADREYRAEVAGIQQEAERWRAGLLPDYPDPIVVFGVPAAPGATSGFMAYRLLFDGRWRWTSGMDVPVALPVPPGLGSGPIPGLWRVPPDVPNVGGSPIRPELNRLFVQDVQGAWMATGSGLPSRYPPVTRAQLDALVAWALPVMERLQTISLAMDRAEAEAGEVEGLACDEVGARLVALGGAVSVPAGVAAESVERETLRRGDGKLPTDPRLPKAPWWWDPEEEVAAAGGAGRRGPAGAAVGVGAGAGQVGPSPGVAAASPGGGNHEFFVGERDEQRVALGDWGEARLEERIGVEGRLGGSLDVGATSVDAGVEGSLRAGVTVEGEAQVAAGPVQASGSGEFFVGAEVAGAASGHLGLDGVAGEAGGSAFAGERLSGSGQVSEGGVTAHGGAGVSAGLGVHGSVSGSASWNSAGFELDLGAAVGFGVDTSLGFAVNPQGMWDSASGAVSGVGGDVADAWGAATDFVGGFLP